MACGSGIEFVLEEIEKCWGRRHFGQSRVVAHHDRAMTELARREGFEAGTIFRSAHSRECGFDHDFPGLLRRSGRFSVVHSAPFSLAHHSHAA